MSDVEFYTKNLLACAHNLIGVIENKQWERLDKKTWALKDAYTKLKIHRPVESKEDNKAFGEQDDENQEKWMDELLGEFEYFRNRGSAFRPIQLSLCRKFHITRKPE